jgi:hypothetical protein
VSRRGVYRGVYSALLDDPDYQCLSAEQRLVLLTLRLCREAGAAAIFRVYVAVLAEQTGLPPAAVEQALDQLARTPSPAQPWIHRDGPVVWVRNALRYDPNIRLADAKHRKAIERAVSALPRLPIVATFCQYYGIASPFDDPRNGLRRPSEDLSPPNTESEVLPETESEGGVRAPSPSATTLSQAPHGTAHQDRHPHVVPPASRHDLVRVWQR